MTEQNTEPIVFSWDEIKVSLEENARKEWEAQQRYFADLKKVELGEMSIAFFELKYFGMVLTYGANYETP